jgi:hypothetical protein
LATSPLIRPAITSAPTATVSTVAASTGAKAPVR